MTPRTPGLDPERVEAGAAMLVGVQVADELAGQVAARAVLAADDAHARSRGLVCAGDAVPVATLTELVAATKFLITRCGPKAPDRLRAEAALAALPSSLLDNPEADRG